MARVKNWVQALRKATEWRTIAWFLDFIIFFIFTGNIRIATGAASLSAFIKFIVNLIWIRKRFS